MPTESTHFTAYRHGVFLTVPLLSQRDELTALTTMHSHCGSAHLGPLA